MPEAHSTSASRGPAYSRTIASCTIVNSGGWLGCRPASARLGDDHHHQCHEEGQHRGSDISCAGSSMQAPRWPGGWRNRSGWTVRTPPAGWLGSTGGGDGDLAAGPIPPRRFGVDAGQRQRDGARKSRPTTANRSATGSAVSRSRPTAATATIRRVVPARMAGRGLRNRGGAARVICCLQGCLRRSRHGCATPAPTRPPVAWDLAGHPITTGAPRANPRSGRPPRYDAFIAPPPGQSVRLARRRRGEMHAPGVRAANHCAHRRFGTGSPGCTARSCTASVIRRDRRPCHEIPRFPRSGVTSTSVSGAARRRTPLQRFGERGGRVLHPRREGHRPKASSNTAGSGRRHDPHCAAPTATSTATTSRTAIRPGAIDLPGRKARDRAQNPTGRPARRPARGRHPAPAVRRAQTRNSEATQAQAARDHAGGEHARG